MVLHDDARFVGTLAQTLDQPAVRAQVGEWTGAAFDQAARLAGDPKQTKAARQAVGQLQRAITSDAPLEPLITAVSGVVIATRDAAVTQLEARTTPKTAVRADVAPLLAVAGVTIDQQTAKGMGLTLEKGKRVSLPLLTVEQLDLLQRRYDLMVAIRQWAPCCRRPLRGWWSPACSRSPSGRSRSSCCAAGTSGPTDRVRVLTDDHRRNTGDAADVA